MCQFRNSKSSPAPPPFDPSPFYDHCSTSTSSYCCLFLKSLAITTEIIFRLKLPWIESTDGITKKGILIGFFSLLSFLMQPLCSYGFKDTRKAFFWLVYSSWQLTRINYWLGRIFLLNLSFASNFLLNWICSPPIEIIFYSLFWFQELWWALWCAFRGQVDSGFSHYSPTASGLGISSGSCTHVVGALQKNTCQRVHDCGRFTTVKLLLHNPPTAERLKAETWGYGASWDIHRLCFQSNGTGHCFL